MLVLSPIKYFDSMQTTYTISFSCCSKLYDKGDDKECLDRFCHFEAISQANVISNFNLKIQLDCF